MASRVLSPTAKDLYDLDFFEWTVRNAELLRAGRTEEADLKHIAEEIEDMGVSQRWELCSRLRVLLTHLLKWKFQPVDPPSGSWRATINSQRDEIADLLEDMPSLRALLPQRLSGIYRRAASRAAEETSLPENSFPPTCPFTLDQILDTEFFPD